MELYLGDAARWSGRRTRAQHKERGVNRPVDSPFVSRLTGAESELDHEPA